MVENLKLPLCKEKRSCYLNTQSASVAVLKKKMVYVPFVNKPMYYRCTLRGKVLMMRLLLSLKWCTPL